MLSFVLDGFKTEEVGSLLDKEGIAVRSGHHCAQPILRRFWAGKYRATFTRTLQHLRRPRCAGRGAAQNQERQRALNDNLIDTKGGVKPSFFLP